MSEVWRAFLAGLAGLLTTVLFYVGFVLAADMFRLPEAYAPIGLLLLPMGAGVAGFLTGWICEANGLWWKSVIACWPLLVAAAFGIKPGSGSRVSWESLIGLMIYVVVFWGAGFGGAAVAVRIKRIFRKSTVHGFPVDAESDAGAGNQDSGGK